MAIYKCPKCGRRVKMPLGLYSCKYCGPEVTLLLEKFETKVIEPGPGVARYAAEDEHGYLVGGPTFDYVLKRVEEWVQERLAAGEILPPEVSIYRLEKFVRFK